MIFLTFSVIVLFFSFFRLWSSCGTLDLRSHLFSFKGITFRFFYSYEISINCTFVMVVWSRMALTPGVFLLFRNTALKKMKIFMEVNSILRLSPFAPTEFQCQTHTICSYLVTHIPRLLLRMVSFRVHVPTK